MKVSPSILAPLLCLCTLLALSTPIAHAGDTPAAHVGDPSPEVRQLEQKLEQLDKLEATPANKQLKEVYQQILGATQEQAGYQDKIKNLSQQLKEHASRSRELKQAIEQESLPQPSPTLADKSLQDLDRLLEAAAAEKISLQNQAEETQSRLAQLQARLVPAQSELSEAKKALDQTAKDSQPPSSALDNNLASALLLKKRKLHESRTAQIQALDLELLTIPNQMELAGLKKGWLAQKQKNLGLYLEQLQSHMRHLRQAESASILDESLKLREGNHEDPALGWLAEENIALGNQLAAYVEKYKAISDRRASLEQLTKLIEDRYGILKQQLELGGDSEGIGELMRQTLIQLKTLGQENTQETIADIQKAQIQSLTYLRMKGEVSDKTGFVETVVARFPTSQLTIVNPEMRERLASLLELRQSLLTKLLERNQQTLKNWGLLLNAQNQFNDQIVDFNKLLMENLLWTATNRPMGPTWFKELVADLDWPSLEDVRKELGGLLARQGGALGGLSAAFALLVYFLRFHLRPRFRSWQAEANEAVGNVRCDRFRNTLYMLAGEILFSLATPLFLLALRRILGHFGDEEAWILALADGLKMAALATFLLGLLRRLAKPGGLLEGQLRWPAATASHLHRAMAQRWLPILLITFVYVEETQTQNLFRYEFGRLPFFALCLLIAHFFRKFAGTLRPAKPKQPSAHWDFQQTLYWMANLFALGQAGLAGMEAFGFHLGAFVLQGRMLKTLGWLLAVTLAYQAIARWLLLEEHRMAYAKAKAMRAERRAAGEELGDEASWEHQRRQFAEIQSISLQSQTLMRLLAGAAFLAAAGWIWSDLIPAFHLLDQVTLWETTSGTDGSTRAISLNSLFQAMIVAGLSVLAIRYLPGLLQLLVLQHLNLAPGSGFAATTLLKYLIFGIGLVSTFHLLGVQWNDLQWLVAALGVGLGFGLQEIFANFVSGLIILFERPVRIGDIVTLGNGVTGTIDTINTRSTTLTDWDNKEIIIPNKSLITAQLTNWSLSSLIIRVVIPVGVAYGSDTGLVCRLLMQAAKEHPQVLDKPERTVLFREFGASALNFELRCFVASPTLRAGVIHDLNMHIHTLFQEHGVEIAYPQMDVHIRKGTQTP